MLIYSTRLRVYRIAVFESGNLRATGAERIAMGQALQ